MRHILFATGFLQGTRHNRLSAIAGAVRFKTTDSISLHNWRDDPVHLAKQMSSFDKVVLIGYSFGGHLVAEIAKNLGDKPVEGMFLCDAISQPTSWSYTDWVKKEINVTPNVEKLWSWRQTSWYPRGSSIRVSDNTDWVCNAVLNNVRHGKMDMHPDFYYEIIKFALERK